MGMMPEGNTSSLYAENIESAIRCEFGDRVEVRTTIDERPEMVNKGKCDVTLMTLSPATLTLT